jgi:hypothetical protein
MGRIYIYLLLQSHMNKSAIRRVISIDGTAAAAAGSREKQKPALDACEN